MWKAPNSDVGFFCFTTNSFLRKDGKAVMGRGIAFQVAQRFPNIPVILGKKINHLVTYGIRQCGVYKVNNVPVQMTAFQVKQHWKQPADLELIDYSTKLLARIATHYPKKIVLLNYPGIGNGRLAQELVEPILEQLPNNVWVYKYKKG